MNNVFKYAINDDVSFDQIGEKYGKKGDGKILMLQEYILCNAYLVEMKDGTKLQVREEHIISKK
ncbi:hypothetical protein [Escherichia phage vB_EcoM-LTH01]|nr:hypothetical protein [Escherichia phage UPEC06]